MNKLDESK
ncbi:hypothetical protein CGLO_05619 [Colletotrichum gloeosporioides Cg-14]|uniref:Uncharacterized protein n=1 Tax=Colletotrichum gloeosporioides (strain Cg-14) TaxID=1237896 RepID=T0KGK0_COLGC|nr:hypothetical protein CGLO_05619 [Colletotrichum gloeosporioides Cg-14]